MTQPDQRCGTCKFWQSWIGWKEKGDCNVPLPSCVHRNDRVGMLESEGATCPCWEAKNV